ncbi:MAG: hypothetical protein U1C49_02725 [Candidatus Andersenbacteria bacterium]|nr:hypothetical protein [bacterium]MDZ4225741.1 hypothetical protein [Candidatus Andersenbacteria bacterium]
MKTWVKSAAWIGLYWGLSLAAIGKKRAVARIKYLITAVLMFVLAAVAAAVGAVFLVSGLYLKLVVIVGGVRAALLVAGIAVVAAVLILFEGWRRLTKARS